VELRTVTLGPLDGQRQAINSGLRAGETVVTDGVDRLRPGAQVEVASARPEVKPPAEKKGGGRRGQKKAGEKAG
jgi:multidrug efflux system membrane fusion protein